MTEAEQLIRLESTHSDLIEHSIDLLPFFRASKKFETSTHFSREIRVGRGKHCEVILPDDQINAFFSREHFAILRKSPCFSPVSDVRNGNRNFSTDRFYVQDLGSRNGTFLDGNRLAPHEWVRVENGQTLRVGNFRDAWREYVFRMNVKPIERVGCAESSESKSTEKSLTTERTTRKRLSIYDQDLFAPMEEVSTRVSSPSPAEGAIGRESVDMHAIDAVVQAPASVRSVVSSGRYLEAPQPRELFPEKEKSPLRRSKTPSPDREAQANQSPMQEKQAHKSNGSLHASEVQPIQSAKRSLSEDQSPHCEPLFSPENSSFFAENSPEPPCESVPRSSAFATDCISPFPCESSLQPHQRDALGFLCTSLGIVTHLRTSADVHTSPPRLSHLPLSKSDIRVAFVPQSPGSGKKLLLFSFLNYFFRANSSAMALLLVPHEKVLHWKREIYKWESLCRETSSEASSFEYLFHVVEANPQRKGGSSTCEDFAPSLIFAKEFIRLLRRTPVVIVLSYDLFTAIMEKDDSVYPKHASITKGVLRARDIRDWASIVILDDDPRCADGIDRTRAFSALRSFEGATSRIVLSTGKSVVSSLYHSYIFRSTNLENIQNSTKSGLPAQQTQDVRGRITIRDSQGFMFFAHPYASPNDKKMTHYAIAIRMSDLQEKIVTQCLEFYQRMASIKKGPVAHRIADCEFHSVLAMICTHTNLFYRAISEYIAKKANRFNQSIKSGQVESKSMTDPWGSHPNNVIQIRFQKVSKRSKATKTPESTPIDSLEASFIANTFSNYPSDPLCNLQHNPKMIVLLNAMKATRLHNRKCVVFARFEGMLDILSAILQNTPIATFSHAAKVSPRPVIFTGQRKSPRRVRPGRMQEGVHFIHLASGEWDISDYSLIDSFEQSDSLHILLVPMQRAHLFRLTHLSCPLDVFIDDSSCTRDVFVESAVHCATHIGNHHTTNVYHHTTNVYHLFYTKSSEEIRYIPDISARMTSFAVSQRNSTVWGYLSSALNHRWAGVQQFASVLTEKTKVTWEELKIERHPLYFLRKKEDYVRGIYLVPDVEVEKVWREK